MKIITIPQPHHHRDHHHDQVTLEKDNGTFGVVVRGGSHDVPMRCRPFTVIQVVLIIWVIMIMMM